MRAKKKVISNLTKCYSIAPLFYQGKTHFLVAAEKQDPCYLFNGRGEQVDTVWKGPGGVMTMVQVHGTDGVFLATQRFYSPNDSKDARIVVAKPCQDGKWQVHTLVCLPHVHRFDILRRNGVRYLLACTLKSGHEYKDDWTMPGKVYAAVLPDDLDCFHEENQLELRVIRDQLTKNHGYYRIVEEGVETGLVSAQEGIFRFTPPADADGKWEIEQLTQEPASDAVLVDMDQDGEKELVFISHFHGSRIGILKKSGQGPNQYKPVYWYDDAPFAHAIYGGLLMGRPVAMIGHREGKRDLLVFTYNQKEKRYHVEVLDHDCGPANVYKFEEDGREILISANREINEIAMYTDFTEDGK